MSNFNAADDTAYYPTPQEASLVDTFWRCEPSVLLGLGGTDTIGGGGDNGDECKGHHQHTVAVCPPCVEEEPNDPILAELHKLEDHGLAHLLHRPKINPLYRQKSLEEYGASEIPWKNEILRGTPERLDEVNVPFPFIEPTLNKAFKFTLDFVDTTDVPPDGHMPIMITVPANSNPLLANLQAFNAGVREQSPSPFDFLPLKITLTNATIEGYQIPLAVALCTQEPNSVATAPHWRSWQSTAIASNLPLDRKHAVKPAVVLAPHTPERNKTIYVAPADCFTQKYLRVMPWNIDEATLLANDSRMTPGSNDNLYCRIDMPPDTSRPANVLQYMAILNYFRMVNQSRALDPDIAGHVFAQHSFSTGAGGGKLLVPKKALNFLFKTMRDIVKPEQNLASVKNGFTCHIWPAHRDGWNVQREYREFDKPTPSWFKKKPTIHLEFEVIGIPCRYGAYPQ